MPKQRKARSSARIGGGRATLRYTADATPGFRRERSRQSFRFLGLRGQPLRSQRHLRRIQDLAIPPAWTNVWICPDPRGHLQATGRDERGRKQFLYHPRWRETRDRAKYDKLTEFAAALPGIRTRVARDLRRAGLPREKVLATIVKLLDMSHIRVGNTEYAKQNGSYGLTTLKDRHVTVRGSAIRFRFAGKSGKEHDRILEHPRLAKIVRRCQELPGQHLFQYRDEAGELRGVGSRDVNDYLRAISGREITAKDFRTWSGTVLAFQALLILGDFETPAEARRKVNQAIAAVAERLGNTKAVCRKCYVHPAVIEGYEARSRAFHLPLTTNAGGVRSGRLSKTEAAVKSLLRGQQPKR